VDETNGVGTPETTETLPADLPESPQANPYEERLTYDAIEIQAGAV